MYKMHESKASGKKETKMKVILDLDTGIDDGMALAYAVGNPDIELIGVTGTYGNVYTKDGVQNVLNILQMFGRTDIPVYAGEDHAIKKEKFDRLEVSARIHGQNGVGEVSMEKASRDPESLSAVDYLIQSVRQLKKELTIVMTGPVTNLATAIKKDPDIVEMMGKVIIMGGALTVPGNVNPYAEANIYQDPDAADYLFKTGADITMVGLDVTQRSQLTFDHTNAWRATKSLAGKAYADMVDYYIAQHEHSNGTACFLHDPSAAVCAVHPEYFTMLPMHMMVVTKGEAAGRTIGDAEKMRDLNPNVKVCVGVESEKLEKHLQNVFLQLFTSN